MFNTRIWASRLCNFFLFLFVNRRLLNFYMVLPSKPSVEAYVFSPVTYWSYLSFLPSWIAKPPYPSFRESSYWSLNQHRHKLIYVENTVVDIILCGNQCMDIVHNTKGGHFNHADPTKVSFSSFLSLLISVSWLPTSEHERKPPGCCLPSARSQIHIHILSYLSWGFLLLP